MRRVALLLAGALALGGAGAVAGASPAHAPKKHVKKHAKKAKHCKRAHGRRHCPKTHRTPTHETVSSSPTTPSTTPPAGGQPQPDPTPAPPVLGHLQVVAREFTLKPSRLTLAAGTVAVELDNFGQDPHDLRVERADNPASGFDFALSKPGAVSSKKLELAPGKWKLYCTLPGHDQAGMHAFVTVTG
ncbi:MAG: hypothetical protein QOK25_2799 [Thermoleophilaceae bacterium]|nr:hypothetical protein [Thermoleophilaceae bacterium]